MSKSNTTETNLLKYLFEDVAFPGLGASVYLALHTADPGEAGDQTTTEATYTSYARVAVLRTGAGFTVTGNTVVNDADIAFPTCTGGSETLTHWSVGINAIGASTILYSGSLSSTLAVSNTIAPRVGAGLLSITED